DLREEPRRPGRRGRRVPGAHHPHRSAEPSAPQHGLRAARGVMKKSNLRAFATRTIHAGQSPDPSTGAVMTPIYATSTYVQESPGKHKGFDYSRSINPTRLAYEKCIADLESGTRGWAFASGLAAMATALDALESGSHV